MNWFLWAAVPKRFQGIVADELKVPLDVVIAHFSASRVPATAAFVHFKADDNPHRPTRDMDFLGFGDPDPEATLKIFREVCDVTADDGVKTC